MPLRYKIYICISFLCIYVIGCAEPPAPKPIAMTMPMPMTTIKPSQKSYTKLDPHILKQLNRYHTKSWKYVVVHHSASNSGNATEFDKFHREIRGWKNGLGYHFVIGNGKGSGNGEIEIGNRWKNQLHGAHAGVKEYNNYGIGICLVGNFNKSVPTAKQMTSLSALVDYLTKRCHIPPENILMHRHCKSTECPGIHFPYYKLLANTFRYYQASR